MLSRKYWFIIPLIVLILSYESILETFQIHLSSPIKKADFTVLSYNVGTFSLDRFSHNVDRDTFMYVDTTLAFIQNRWMQNLKTDIVCFQEFYSNDKYAKCENMTSRLVSLGYKHYYFNKFVVKSFLGHFGVSIFSKYPIIKADSIPFPSPPSVNRACFADIKIGKDTVRIISFHLQSLSLINRNGKFFSKFAQEVKKIADNLTQGLDKHEKQLISILKVADESPYPVVLCGDFNNVPYSYTYQKTKQKFKNSFEKAGSGFGFTMNSFPYFVRIDNQFYKGDIDIAYFKTGENENSDHLPLEAGYYFK